MSFCVPPFWKGHQESLHIGTAVRIYHITNKVMVVVLEMLAVMKMQRRNTYSVGDCRCV